MVVQVPTSRTAVGQLQLKGIDLPSHRCDVVTTRLVPTLTQRIAMSCVIALELTP